MTFFTPLL